MISSSYDRIVVKAGTSLLTSGTDHLDLKLMESLVNQISDLHSQGLEMVLVSSGAVAAGRQVLGIPRESKTLPARQMLAAVGQGHLMHLYAQFFEQHKIPVAQALLSRENLDGRLGYLNVRNTLLELINHKVIPIVNENDVVAIEELTGEIFGDNDSLSAMVANLIDADLLILLGEVEGLFTADPNLDPGAHLISKVDRLTEDISSKGGPPWDHLGSGGMVTKLEAARLATASAVNVVIASGTENNIIKKLAVGVKVGTLFPATSTKMESRKRWMLSGLSTQGHVLVDKGAVTALLEHNRSLLPAGVTKILGSFDRGDVISILNSAETKVACGITNYNSSDLSKIKGVHSNHIENILGHHYGVEVVHRNNMVIL